MHEKKNFLLFSQSPAAMFKTPNGMLLIEITAWVKKITDCSLTECAGFRQTAEL